MTTTAGIQNGRLDGRSPEHTSAPRRGADRREYSGSRKSARQGAAALDRENALLSIAVDAFTPDGFIDTFRETVRCSAEDCFF
jgi:hypothetical protein